MSSYTAPDRDKWSVDSGIMGYHIYQDHIIRNLLPFFSTIFRISKFPNLEFSWVSLIPAFKFLNFLASRDLVSYKLVT